MKMQDWLGARCAKLLEELNDIPFSDDSDELKLKLLMTAMRESSVEMFSRAAESSRVKIKKINNDALADTIDEVEKIMAQANAIDIPEPIVAKKIKAPVVEKKIKLTSKHIKPKATVEEVKEKKTPPKIKLSSSIIRRVKE